jgi:hypothetical protein
MRTTPDETILRIAVHAILKEAGGGMILIRPVGVFS